MIADSTISKVKDLDLKDVLENYGLQFTRSGKTWFACCPFHGERTGSFSVNPYKNLYYCHSCHRGGDAIRFYMDKEGLTYSQAVEAIARANGVGIDYTKTEMTEEQRLAAMKRESMLATLDKVQQFFMDQLRVETSDEARAARKYTYGRWPEEFCATAGIGYAPARSDEFLDFCRSQALSEEILFLLGLLQRGEDGRAYAMFRSRVMIPIRNRMGRIIAYTARYIGNNPKAPKYKNSSNSDLFTKSESIFGIDRAARCREADFFNILEGAPDVLRLQAIGLNNSVAALGTAWSENQFEQLKKLTEAVCFIPDSDPPKEGEPFGPGFKAVMTNGAAAMRLGLSVSVRELPFEREPVRVPLFDFEIEEAEENMLAAKIKAARKAGKNRKEIAAISLSEAERAAVCRQRDLEPFLHKNDADSYILSQDRYAALEEKPFVIWLAEKKFTTAQSIAEERKVVAEIADLLRYVKEPSILSSYIDGLSAIHGKPKLWAAAVAEAKDAARKKAPAVAPKNERERDLELLRQFNLSIRDNCYFTFDGDDEPTRLSNFVLEPLFHIQDESNGTRIFKMKNKYGDVRVIELRESELNSLSAFMQRVGSLGNFVWRAKIDKLNNVKEYTYAKTDSAERIRKLGWDAVGEFFAFGNGIFIDGKFKPVDELGIIRDCRGSTYYIPATSKMYQNNSEIFQFERLMVHENRSGITLHDFAEKLIAVFGENARIALCYLLSTIFRDIIFKRTRHFPILNLFGEKGTGKTTLATSLQSFFIHGIDPPNMGVTSIPAMNDRVSQAVNTLVVFDEYKNDLDVRKIAFAKGLWGGGGQTKKNTNTDGMAAQTIVSTGIALCGQDKPTQDMALFTRLIFLAFTKTSFNQEERKRYDDLTAVCNIGLTHLLVEVLTHRAMFEKNFAQAYALIKSELAAKLADEEVHDRIFGNWLIPLATFRTLESVIDLPFSYNELLETAVKGLRNQSDMCKESSEVADFWNILQGLQTTGRCVDKAHYRIRYHRTFRALSMKEDMVFAEARPVLYLNAPAVSALFNGNRGANSTANRSNWATTLSYLKSHPAFLGLKQDRFVILTPQGIPDFTYEAGPGGTQTRKLKVNRPKALCFDYAQLKETFGLNLETEVLTEAEDYAEDNQSDEQQPPAAPPELFYGNDDDRPF